MPTQTIDLKQIAYRAMEERGFLTGFSPQAIQEAAKLQPFLTPNASNQIQDLRHLRWCSIDNVTSRDLDQLTYAEKKGDKYIIYIAVASVSESVPRGSAIDLHAMQNTTSVYTPAIIFPMLPERLSTDLTSLNPNEDRIALIFEGTLSSEGKLEQQEIYEAYVHNYAKLVYETVTSWLEGGAAPDLIRNDKELSQQLILQDQIALQLEKYRHQYGSLCLETIDSQAVISQGIPIDIQEASKGRAHKIIENFMIIANTISARYSEKNKQPSLRRVVKEPKRWDRIVAIASGYGEKLPNHPDSIALEKFLESQKRKNRIAFPDLSLTIIKLLGKGEYVVLEPGKPLIGHFGLALRDYTHSTAPNRRFPDLITQRQILASIRGKVAPYRLDELFSLAGHCTEKEDDAEKIERRTKKSAAAYFLSSFIGKEFDAIITGMSSKGTWVRIFAPPAEGKLIESRSGLDVGDRLRVKLVHTDVSAGYIDFVQV